MAMKSSGNLHSSFFKWKNTASPGTPNLNSPVIGFISRILILFIEE